METRAGVLAGSRTIVTSVDGADGLGGTSQARRRTPSWKTLAVMAGLADACFLTILAGLRSDPLAAGIAALFFGAVGLRFLRKGTASQILLALLFSEVSARMAPSVVTNAAAGDVGTGMAIPFGLAVISLFGLGVTGMSLLRRPGPVVGRSLVVGLAGTLLLPALLLSGMYVAFRPADAGETPGLRMSMDNLAFSVTQLDMAAGEVRIRLENDDLIWHTFTIDALGVDVKLPVGARRDASFNAPSGTYSFVCRVPGHGAMRGTLRVD